MSDALPSKAPELVEILRLLGKHHWSLWQQTYGKIEKADEQEEQERAFGDFHAAFHKGHNRKAAGHLCRFISFGGKRVSEAERKKIYELVSKAVRARRAAQKVESAMPKTAFGDLGDLVSTAYEEFAAERLKEHRVSKAEYDACRNHPLSWLCRQLEDRGVGLNREEIEWCAHRLNTIVGLQPMKWPDEEEDWPDRRWLGGKCREFDRDGVTDRLWNELVNRYPDVLKEAGFQDADKDGEPTGKSEPDGDPAESSALPAPRFERAYQSSKLAETDGDFDKQPTDSQAYEWLKEHGPEDYKLPFFPTWQRYVRRGRRHHKTQKHSPRSGRTGRSIGTPDDLQRRSDGD